MGQSGVIYILTNPSFPNYVKIGYADDIELRLRQLNRSECIPFAFRVYATYEGSSRLSDKKVHEIIDRLNPNLRSIESFGGKTRVREFYAMSAEDAYSVLEAIAEINDRTDKLHKHDITQSEQESLRIAGEVQVAALERMENFSFSKCNIPVGSILHYVDDKAITCTVVSDKKVLYNGAEYSLSALAKLLHGKWRAYQGPKWFVYEDKLLDEIRNQMDI